LNGDKRKNLILRVLIIASGNSGKIAPFIQDQINDLEKEGVSLDKFLVKGKGLFGYLGNYKGLLKKIVKNKPTIIHAHYGMSGLLATLQRRVPVVITFHGSDINEPRNRFLSRIADKLCNVSIFVSKELSLKIRKKNPIIIPCGVNLDTFYPINDKNKTKLKLGLKQNEKNILFSSNFSNKVKNYSLAKEAVSKVKEQNIKLIELKGYDRNEVALLLNTVDIALLTSFSEASSQFTKEAMACNTPIVTTNVGDAKEVIGNTKGCFITTFEPEDVAKKIQLALDFGKRTTGRKDIQHLESGVIAKKIIKIYKSVLTK